MELELSLAILFLLTEFKEGACLDEKGNSFYHGGYHSENSKNRAACLEFCLHQPYYIQVTACEYNTALKDRKCKAHTWSVGQYRDANKKAICALIQPKGLFIMPQNHLMLVNIKIKFFAFLHCKRSPQYKTMGLT